jgi:hypothetical protein
LNFQPAKSQVKKIITIILCFVYAIASSGATINFHYCMGKFTGWDVAAASTEKCGKCGMHKEARKGCCNDARATVTINTDQLVAVTNAIPGNQFISIHPLYQSLIQLFLKTGNGLVKHANGPPFISAFRSFIRNCVFRI